MAPSQYVYSPLSLHDALPIYGSLSATIRENSCYEPACLITEWSPRCISPLAPSTSADLPIVEFSSVDRKSTRLNSSHVAISYADFCLQEKYSLKPILSGLI